MQATARRTGLLLLPLALAVPCGAAAQARAAGPADAAVPRYDLAIALDPGAHRLEAAGTVTLPPTPARRDTIELRLRAEFDSLRVEVLAPAASAGPATLARREREGRTPTWVVTPRAPIPAGVPVRLGIRYAGGRTPGFLLYLGSEGSFASGTWYPRWGAGTATGTLRFQVPPGVTVVATGTATPDAAGEAAGRFAFVVTRPAELSFAAARYQVQRVGGAQPITVYSLRPRANVAALAGRLAAVVAVLAREFGPLPGGEFALAEAPAERAGAAGFDGASLDGMILATESYLDGPFNMGFFAHEVGHQWWGVSVRHRGTEGKYLLDEAMAQYGALRVVEALEGPAMARSFRQLGYPGMSFTHGLRGYAYLARAGYDYPLSALPDTGYLAQVSHDLADGKGFLVHDLVSRSVGRERFRAAQQRFLREHAGSEATFGEWKAAVEAAAGRRLDALWAQWYGRPGLPRFQLEWRQAGGAVEGTVRQEAPFYDATLPLLVRFAEGAVTRRVPVGGAATRFRFPVGDTVRAVELDPDGLVPRWTPALLAEAGANAGGMRAYVDALFRQDPAAARGELERMLREVPEPDLYATRFGAHYLLGTLAFFAGDSATAKREFALALASPTRSAESLPWLYVRLAHLAQREADPAAMRRALADALSADAAGDRPSGVAAYIARSFPPTHPDDPPRP